MSAPLQLLLEQYDDAHFAARARCVDGVSTVDGFLFHSPKARGDLRDMISEKLRGGHEAACEITLSIAKTPATLLHLREGSWPPREGLESWKDGIGARLGGAAGDFAAVALNAGTGEPHAGAGAGDLFIALVPFRDIDRARDLAKGLHAGEPRIQSAALATLSFLSSLPGGGDGSCVANVAILPTASRVILVKGGRLVGVDSVDIGMTGVFEAIQEQLNLKFIGSAAKLVYDGIYEFADIAPAVLKGHVARLRECLESLAVKAGVKPDRILMTCVPPTARWIEEEITDRLEIPALPLEGLPCPAFEGEAEELKFQRGLLPLWHLAQTAGATPFAQVNWARARSLPELLHQLPARGKPKEPPAAPAPKRTVEPLPAPGPEATKGASASRQTTAKEAPKAKVGPRPDPKSPQTETILEKESPPPVQKKKAPEAKRATIHPEASAAGQKGKKPVALTAAAILAALLVLGIVFLFHGEKEEEAVITLAPPAAPPAAAPLKPEPSRVAEAEPETVPLPPSPPPPDAVGALAVTTRPGGATARIGGELVGTTPLRVAEHPAGQHTLVLEMEGHEARTLEVEVAEGELTALEDIPLRAFAGGMVLVSEPAGATVLLNGEETGATPLRLESVPVGAHTITLELEGHETETFEVEIADQETVRPPVFTLRPESGALLIRSVPEGVVFRLVGVGGNGGGESLGGITPAELSGIAPGSHRVIFEREGWPNFTRPAAVRRNEITEILMEYPGARLVLSSNPKGAEVWSRDGETLLGTTPLAMEDLRPHRMRCVIRHPEHLPEPITIDLEPNGEHNHEIELTSLERVFSPDEVDVLPAPRDNPLPETSLPLLRQETVHVRFIVDRNGKPTDLTIQNSTNNRLNQLVLNTVGEWTFEPAVLRETPVRVRVVAPIIFNPAERLRAE